jgi:CubicO group peptidase (beta-lactamase class C family)
VPDHSNASQVPFVSKTTRIIVASMLAAAPSLLVGQNQTGGARPSPAALGALVDSVVKSALMAKGAPSVSVLITRGNETLLQRALGLADVAAGRPADASTRYGLGSVSKQFTAALVLRQVERGRLSLGDSLGRHFAGAPAEWRAITIEQLLNHTSGLAPDFRDPDRRTETRTPATLVAIAMREPMAAAPGTRWIYSNTGYMLLGALVEKLYGKPYAAVLRDEIARPLGLTTLRWCGDRDAAPEATGYERAPDGTSAPAVPTHPSQMLGMGAICATTRDVEKWNRALHGGRVLSAASYAAMTTPRGAMAAAESYGFGLVVRRAPWGGMVMLHGGEASGFTAENAWYPADSLSVTVLYNGHPRVPPFGGVDLIAALALGRTPPAAPKPASVAAIGTPATSIVGEEAQRRFVGDYEATPGVVFAVAFRDGSFHVTPPRGTPQPMVHESGATYAVGRVGSPTTATFLVDASGQVVGMLTRQNGAERTLRKVK